MSVGFYLDQSRCTGCRACQVVCKDKNRLEVGTLYREAHSYTVGEFPKVQGFSYTFSCNHCEDPVCLKNCPTGAIYKAADGTVIQDQSKCIGCRMCVMKRVFPVSATAAMACVKRAPNLLAWLAARTVRLILATWMSCARSMVATWITVASWCCPRPRKRIRMS